MSKNLMSALTGLSLLSDAEVSGRLALEMARERDAADREMDAIIAWGQSQTAYLSAAIFDPVERNEHWYAVALDAQSREEGKSAYYKGCSATIREQTRIELEVSRKLRAARLPVSHTDPHDYWEQRSAEWSRQPIWINMQAGGL